MASNKRAKKRRAQRATSPAGRSGKRTVRPRTRSDKRQPARGGSPNKTLAPVRKGIEYQDLVAAQSLLKLLEGTPPPAYVTIEDRHGGKFDDVVEWYHDRVVWQQVKWAEHPASQPYTLQNLAQPQRGRKTSLVKGFGRSYAKVKPRTTNFELHVVSNRTADTEFRKYLEGEPPRIKRSLTRSQRKTLEDMWRMETGLDSADFRRMVDCLRFRLGLGDLAERAEAVRYALRALSSGIEAERFLAAVRDWSKRKDIQSIFPDDVRGVLGAGADYPDNRFKLHLDTLVDRATPRRKLEQAIAKFRQGYVVLLGSPGSGKSTLLNTFQPGPALSRQRTLITYNCFTGAGDAMQACRASADNFSTFLGRQLYQRFGPPLGHLLQAPPSEIERMLSAVSTYLANDHQLVVVIDGLDYAVQNTVSGSTGVADTLPRGLPPNVLFVVSAQAKEQLPDHLRALADDRILHLSPLTRAETHLLLEKHGAFKTIPPANPFQQKEIRDAVYRASRGHALHATYLAKSLLLAINKGHSAAELPDYARTLEPYDQDIHEYYSRLLAAPQALTRRLLGLMASCPFPLKPEEAAELLPGTASSAAESEDALDHYQMLLSRDSDGLVFAHDSLRAFVATQGWNPLTDPRPLLSFLRSRPEDPRQGEFVLELLVACGETTWARENVDCDFLGRQIALGCKPDKLIAGLHALLRDAFGHRDWGAVAKWCLLRERLADAVPFELDYQDLWRAWLATGRVDRVERRVFDQDTLQIHWSAAIKLAGDAGNYRYDELAGRLRRAAAEEPIEELNEGFDNTPYETVRTYIRNLAGHASPKDTISVIKSCAVALVKSGMPMAGSAKEIEGDLAISAAFAAFWSDDRERLNQWLALKPSPLPRRYVTMLRAFTAVREHNVDSHLPAIRSVLREGASNWWFLSKLAKLRPELVCDALARLPLPPSLRAAATPRWYEVEECSSELADLFNDIRLTTALGLHERLRVVRRAIEAVSSHTSKALHELVFRLAIATRSEPCCEVGKRCLDLIRSMRWRDRDWDERGPVQYLIDEIGSVLYPLLSLSVVQGAVGDFAAWTEAALLPVLSDVGLRYRDAYLSVMTHLVKMSDDRAVYERLLGGLEKLWDEAHSHKSSAWLRTATLAAPLDLSRAERALASGTRAAFTYGYRKDTTVNAAIEALWHVGGVLGEQLPEVVGMMCAALHIMDELTDHDHVNDNAGELVAVLSKFNMPMAAKVARRLQSLLSKQMRRASIAQSAANLDLNVQTLRKAFHELAPDLWFGAERATEAQPTQVKPFAEIAAALAPSQEVHTSGDVYQLQRELVRAATTPAELRDAEQLLVRQAKLDGNRLAELANRAVELQQKELFVEYATRSAESAKPFLGPWGYPASEALGRVCEVDPARGRTIFEKSLHAAIEDRWGIGFSAVPVICRCLMALGEVAAAKSVFGELIAFLREITSVYHPDEAQWRDLLDA